MTTDLRSPKRAGRRSTDVLGHTTSPLAVAVGAVAALQCVVLLGVFMTINGVADTQQRLHKDVNQLRQVMVESGRPSPESDKPHKKDKGKERPKHG
jgi:hypothetical protein